MFNSSKQIMKIRNVSSTTADIFFYPKLSMMQQFYGNFTIFRTVCKLEWNIIIYFKQMCSWTRWTAIVWLLCSMSVQHKYFDQAAIMNWCIFYKIQTLHLELLHGSYNVLNFISLYIFLRKSMDFRIENWLS